MSAPVQHLVAALTVPLSLLMAKSMAEVVVNGSSAFGEVRPVPGAVTAAS